ncbi:hypothetical protein EST38_g12568 [Candolleomyces aberdarensis]|uniref:Uncharacterized protein n=1 Tax=Candolleomyces aberdarensis TaxID=2316362 RepID=A0A4Q2D434_9AGAR|nr:hypothetical protein EST38_g12568 [Candolleomyces aberdarensis]
MAVNTPALGNSGINNRDGSSLVQQTLEVWGEQRVAGRQVVDDKGDLEDGGLNEGEDDGDEGRGLGDRVGTSEDGGSSEGSAEGSEDMPEEDADGAEGHWQHPTPEMEDMIHEFMDELSFDNMSLLRAWNFQLKHNITDAAFDDLRHTFPESNLLSFKAAR